MGMHGRVWHVWDMVDDAILRQTAAEESCEYAPTEASVATVAVKQAEVRTNFSVETSGHEHNFITTFVEGLFAS